MNLLNKVGRTLVLDLLNRDNVEDFTFEDIEFGQPVHLVVPDGIRNTRLLVTPAPGSTYRGSETINYWRLDLAKVIRGQDRIVPGLGITNSSQIVDLMNHKFGTAIDHTDVYFEEIDTSVLPTLYTLRARGGSYAYINSVELQLTNELIALDTIVVRQDLVDVLEHHMPTDAVGGLYMSTSGTLPINNGPSDANSAKITNQELEMSFGVGLSSGLVHGSDMVPGVANIYDLTLLPNQGWDIWFGFGVYDTTRLGESSTLLELYDISMVIRHKGQEVNLTLVKDKSTGEHQWSLQGSLPSSTPEVYFHDGNFGVMSLIRSLDFFSDVFENVQGNAWGALGTFDFELVATPKKAVYLKEVKRNFLVSATQ